MDGVGWGERQGGDREKEIKYKSFFVYKFHDTWKSKLQTTKKWPGESFFVLNVDRRPRQYIHSIEGGLAYSQYRRNPCILQIITEFVLPAMVMFPLKLLGNSLISIDTKVQTLKIT